ncbi:MAG: hypothetical protein ACRYG8_00210, partial [Janthinobacterium lividum]
MAAVAGLRGCGEGSDQLLRIGMRRRVQDLQDRAGFLHFAVPQHDDAVRHLRDHGQVVRDVDAGDP